MKSTILVGGLLWLGTTVALCELKLYPTTSERPVWIAGPAGAKLYAHVHTPNVTGRFPGLVMVPGGVGDGRIFDVRNGRSAPEIARRGFVVVHFDPEGRGRSRGKENYNGYRHQDDLALVIRYLAQLPEVDSDNLGVITFSYGITMAAGCLARYRDLPVKYLIDVEGPSNTQNICYRMPTGRLVAPLWREVVPPEEHADFWRERQAVNFIGQIRCRYLRVQKWWDHVHGPYKGHAIELLNTATQAGVWTRCNDNPPNILYDPEHLEKYHWLRTEAPLLDYLEEMATMPAK